jgi:hypothetical protein
MVHNYRANKSERRKETTIGQMCIDVFGEDWEEFEIAHLSTSDGIGINYFLSLKELKKPL